MLMMMSKTSWITGWEPAGDKRKESKSVSCLPARTRDVSAACQQGQVVSRASGSQHGHPQGIQSGPTTGASIMADHAESRKRMDQPLIVLKKRIKETSSWRTNQSFGRALRKPSSCWRTVEAEVFTEAEINANIIQSTHNSEATTNPNTNEAVHDESHEAFHDQSTIGVQSQEQKSSSPRGPRTAKKPFDSKC
jgi:hypothetical protein